MSPSPSLAKSIADGLDIVEERFKMFLRDKKTYLNIIRRGLTFMGRPRIDEKIRLHESDLCLFSEELLEALVSGGESYNMTACHFIWQRLIDGGIVTQAAGHMPHAFVDHLLNVHLLSRHLSDDTFRNIFTPPSKLAQRYAHAIVAIDVVKNGDERRGSGFIAVRDVDEAAFLVTCRHNVDPNDGNILKNITTAAGKTLKFGNLLLSETYDVAIIPFGGGVDGPVFRLRDDVEMFDDVYTLGYPNVPGAHPVLLGHRGEMNARVDLYLPQCPALIISNLVSPGSSGCPVLTADGRCVGMTIQWLEGEWDKERMRFSAALPAAILRETLNSLTN